VRQNHFLWLWVVFLVIRGERWIGGREIGDRGIEGRFHRCVHDDETTSQNGSGR
jgi:hypothetical protein